MSYSVILTTNSPPELDQVRYHLLPTVCYPDNTDLEALHRECDIITIMWQEVYSRSGDAGTGGKKTRQKVIAGSARPGWPVALEGERTESKGHVRDRIEECDE